MSLYDFGPGLSAINNMLEESGGEVTPEIDAALTDWFASGSADDLAAKLASYAKLIVWHTGHAAIAKAQVDQFASAMKRHQESVDWLESRLLGFMQTTRSQRLETNDGRKFTLCNNGGKQPVQYDEVAVTEVPDAHRKVTVELNREAIRRDLEQGKELPYARLLPRGQHVRLNVV